MTNPLAARFGPELDRFVDLFGFARFPEETDDELRQRAERKMISGAN